MSQPLSKYMTYSLCLIDRLSAPKINNLQNLKCYNCGLFPNSSPNTNDNVIGGLDTKQLTAPKMVYQLQINRVACASVAAEQNSIFRAHLSPSESGLPISLHIKQMLKNTDTAKLSCTGVSEFRKLHKYLRFM